MANLRAQKYVSAFSGGIFTRKTTALNNINKHIDECIRIHNVATHGLKMNGERFCNQADNDRFVQAIEVRINDLIEARDHMEWVITHKKRACK